MSTAVARLEEEYLISRKKAELIVEIAEFEISVDEKRLGLVESAVLAFLFAMVKGLAFAHAMESNCWCGCWRWRGMWGRIG